GLALAAAGCGGAAAGAGSGADGGAAAAAATGGPGQPAGKTLTALSIAALPAKTTYLMGEPLDLTGLRVSAAYSDGSAEDTLAYSAAGDTFSAGRGSVLITAGADAGITAAFPIEVERTLLDTGLPVIYIDTRGGREITSREEYLSAGVEIRSDNPDHSLKRANGADQIRGRGNSSWNNPKKSYRLRFGEKISLFGYPPARNWVLLAEYRSPTLLQNVIAFELGHRFALPFTNHYVPVEVVINGRYNGTYILTEHVQVGEGRVDIDEGTGFLVEMDMYYDEEPKFTTELLELPIMIKSPEDLADPAGYDFIAETFRRLEEALTDSAFPTNAYKDLIDTDNLADYLLINDILMNFELQVPASVYLYKEADGKLRLGPLWDFDCGYGYEGDNVTFFREYEGRLPNFYRRDGYIGQAFFQRFFDDPSFVAQYRERWNEKYPELLDIGPFIETMLGQLAAAQELNNRRWHSVDLAAENQLLLTWWRDRIAYLHQAINET
ncbi:MAG: CotH kinase family protein, partial [Peptococcaceae bacterium]|nr:CotH kinase family protein [Peptococcaceae bacterium]